jgi:hypothetical protein
MSQKLTKKNTKDFKDGNYAILSESSESLDKYCTLSKDYLEFELKFFLISIMLLISSTIYINKTVK